ncbi:MAG: LrgB family protein [Beijerinckiaceae bacterium]|nr:LrgB family protein [Beijerinckiaceae bacterium]
MTLLPSRITDVWVYLSASPLLWLTLTLAAYALASRIAVATGRHPLANPVAIAAALLVGLLLATGTDYQSYFAGAQFVHFLLGPTTVALAVPLYRNRAKVRKALLPMLGALVAGSLTAILSTVAVALALGAPPEIVASLAPKSVTAPIAMSLSASTGGIPTLTAVLVIATGIFGAMTVTPLMNALGLKDYQARGFAAGLAAHGIGTARAFQVDSVAGTFAGIAMGLNGLLTSVLVPLLASVWR